MKYYYDVVLSFAGEDREYVEECADIYSNKAKYSIVFVSKHYVKKRWTSMSLNLLTKECLKVKQNIYCLFFR